MQTPVNCAFASPNFCSASINAAPDQFAFVPLNPEMSRMLLSSLVSAGGVPDPPAGTVPNTPLRMAINSFCMSRSQKRATRVPIAFIGSAPASAADKSVADHIFARRRIAATSLFDVILLSSRSVPSITCSDSPVRSSKNGMLTVGAAWDAKASNSELFAMMPLCTSADSSIVWLSTYGLKSSGTITSCKVVPAI